MFYRVRQVAPLEITRQPNSLDLVEGTNGTMVVEASGEGLLQYQWQFNGTDIPGAIGPSLDITDAQQSQAGDYTVIVSDDVDSITSDPATLTVLVLPYIIQHPQSQTVTEGDSVTFSVTVTNTATLPVTYRWRWNNITVNIQTTNQHNCTYTLPNVRTDDAGDYTVVVSNPAYTTPGFLSQPATLVVLPP
jgi:hypothetical protein